MYTILPIYNDKMPESFMFETMEAAIEGARTDFADPFTPDSKGFMIVEVKKAIGVERSLNENVSIEDYIVQAEEEKLPEDAAQAVEAAPALDFDLDG